jgi:ATP:cob(I)alamin adenosyltransferase
MKIYTKTGDKGTTSLATGTRVPKTNPRIEAYGTVDELTSYVALIRDLYDNNEVKEVLLEILDRLMTIGGILSFDVIDPTYKIPLIKDEDFTYIEGKIDEYTSKIPPLRAFVIPGGTVLSSHCHVARSICRRAERYTLRLAEQSDVPDSCIRYLNRLSDFLFVLARKAIKDADASEIIWKPRVE